MVFIERRRNADFSALRSLAFATLITSVAAILAPVSHAQEAAPEAPAMPVTVVRVAQLDLEESETFTGRVEAIESVALQAKVAGYLKAKHFEEGGTVAVGDLLFELEDDTYSNSVDQARAAVAVAEAQRKLAQQIFERQKVLTERDVQSQASLDTASANLDVAAAQVEVAQSQLDAATLNLDYTRIKSPIAGRIGRSDVSIGALISPTSGPLATVVQTNPIYVSFPVPQAKMLQVQKRHATPDDVIVKLKLSDGSEYAEDGKIAFADIQATTSTDSLLARAVFANPDGVLVGRQVVSVRIVGKTPVKQLAIPQQALLLDQQGAYVLTVAEDGTVNQARIETGQEQGTFMAVTKGLTEGEMVIVGGIQKVRPGMKVAPSEAQNTQ
ncbi:MAG TPA: efflux RND transporter periplasmic adaptor subunit [Albidovulum sp.]|uniref:efflux RND transporter periplasmic adaptor subunit n=1 Tax=Albidovulum sp. TaxID=1872424 RepID=UPI002C086E45|nr:efflux RND transporter periplasmic adaptor subunit [Albidovulum sp.]